MRVLVLSAVLLLSVCVPAPFAKAGEVLENASLVKMLESGLQLPVLLQKIDISDCHFGVLPEDLIKISDAAKKGGMDQNDINKLLQRVMAESGKEEKRLKDLVARFINTTINYDQSNPQEYESNMRMLLREGKRVVPYLLSREYIEAESEQKRAGVLDALAKIGDKSETVQINAKLMLDDRHPAVRQKAAEAIASVGGPKICETLIQELVRPTRTHLDGVAMALGYLGDPKAVESLTILLKRSPNQDARLAAAFALGLLRTTDDKAVLTLLNAILDDGDERLRAAAAKSAGQIRDLRAISYIKRAYQRYRKGRPELVFTLRHFHSADAVEFLIQECAPADNPKVRAAAIRALKALANEDYDSAEEWETWWSINKDTPEWIRVNKTLSSSKK